MTISKEEVEAILSEIKDGNKVLEYISELEEHHHCHCHDEHEHNHKHHCECGCDDEEEDEWEELKTGYINKLTVEDWEELLKDKEIFSKDALIILKRMRHVAAPTSSAELADMFGYGAMYYSLETDKLTERLSKKLNIDYLQDTERWSIIFQGWVSNEEHDTKIFALRPELYEALGNTDLSNIPLRMI